MQKKKCRFFFGEITCSYVYQSAWSEMDFPGRALKKRSEKKSTWKKYGTFFWAQNTWAFVFHYLQWKNWNSFFSREEKYGIQLTAQKCFSNQSQSNKWNHEKNMRRPLKTWKTFSQNPIFKCWYFSEKSSVGLTVVLLTQLTIKNLKKKRENRAPAVCCPAILRANLPERRAGRAGRGPTGGRSRKLVWAEGSTGPELVFEPTGERKVSNAAFLFDQKSTPPWTIGVGQWECKPGRRVVLPVFGEMREN